MDEYNFPWSELSPPRPLSIISIRVPRNCVSFGQLASRLTSREDLSSQKVEQISTLTHSYIKVTRHLVLFNSTKEEEENKGTRGHQESNLGSDSGDIYLPLHHWSAGWRNPNLVTILCDCIHSVTQTTRSSPLITTAVLIQTRRARSFFSIVSQSDLSGNLSWITNVQIVIGYSQFSSLFVCLYMLQVTRVSYIQNSLLSIPLCSLHEATKCSS